jgi:outer membrane murein-binding lipoprotein Lpp
MKRRIEQFIMIVAAGMLLAGCGPRQKPWDRLENCKEENTNLSMQVDNLNTQNTQLKEQLTTALELDKDVRLEAIDTLEKIRIAKRTGFYDSDKDGAMETLAVYLRPIDTAQDSVKAAGKVIVQLWDLTKPHNARISEWAVEPDELLTMWGGNIFDAYYRIKLPLEITPDPQKEYTLKVIFTDYLSGKVLTDHNVVSAQ